MSSSALAAWRGERAARLDNLVSAHTQITGGRPGRKWLTSELNHALLTRLAAEFQGFCRDLHDDAVGFVVVDKFPADAQMRSLVKTLLLNARKLDKGNANWGNIVSDFLRLGVDVGDKYKAAEPARAQGRIAKIDRLNDLRNAIAHSDLAKLAELEQRGRVTLETFRSTRSALNEVASGLNKVVAAYLTDLVGHEPW